VRRHRGDGERKLSRPERGRKERLTANMEAIRNEPMMWRIRAAVDHRAWGLPQRKRELLRDSNEKKKVIVCNGGGPKLDAVWRSETLRVVAFCTQLIGIEWSGPRRDDHIHVFRERSVSRRRHMQPAGTQLFRMRYLSALASQ